MKKHLTYLCAGILLLTGFALQTNAKTSSAFVDPQLMADLSITSQLSAGPYNNGANVTYTITVNNMGPDNATSVLVTDLLPSQLTYVSSITTTGAYNSGTGYWIIGTLANGGTATLAVTAKINTKGILNNCAQVTANEQDADSTNNSTCKTISAQASADVSITSQLSAGPYRNGDNVTITLTASNSGPDAATGVAVTDLLPAKLTFVSSTPSAGTYSNIAGNWVIGNLANGGTATLTLIAEINTTGSITDCSQIAANEYDPNPSNNNACSSFSATGTVNLALTKTLATPPPYTNGETVTYNIIIANNGANTSTGTTVSDILPAGLTYVSVTAPVGSYNAATGVWNIGILTNNAVDTLKITAKINDTGAITNCATASSNEYDTNTADNQSCVTINALSTIDLIATVSTNTPGPYYVGKHIALSVMLLNNSSAIPSGVTVNVPFPANLDFVSAGASVGTYSPITQVWTIGSFTNTGSATVLIIDAVINSKMDFFECVIAKANEFEADTTNNVACLMIPVTSHKDIVVGKTVETAGPYYTGNHVIYSIIALNSSDTTMNNVLISDILPAELSYVSSTSTSGTYTPATGIWAIGNMATGKADTLKITTQTLSAGNVINCASLYNTADDDSTNNYSCATINVSTATGINNLVSDSRILVFPNPANAELVVNQSTVGVNSRISIINTLGQTVLLITKPSASQLIDVSGIANGIYQLKIENDNTTRINKVVVQH